MHTFFFEAICFSKKDTIIMSAIFSLTLNPPPEIKARVPYKRRPQIKAHPNFFGASVQITEHPHFWFILSIKSTKPEKWAQIEAPPPQAGMGASYDGAPAVLLGGLCAPP